MISSHEDYEKYYATLENKESLIKSEIIGIVSSYTIDEARSNIVSMRDEILTAIQGLYQSDFIIDVTFRDITFQ